MLRKCPCSREQRYLKGRFGTRTSDHEAREARARYHFSYRGTKTIAVTKEISYSNRVTMKLTKIIDSLHYKPSEMGSRPIDCAFETERIELPKGYLTAWFEFVHIFVTQS